MSRITYNAESLQIMAHFEKITHAHIKDSFEDAKGTLVFVVQENQLGKAIGKKACNVRLLEDKLKKKIKIIEFNPAIEIFVRNLIYPIKDVQVTVLDGTVNLKGQDSKTKGLLIGRDSRTLKYLESVLKKYFNIQKVKVV